MLKHKAKILYKGTTVYNRPSLSGDAVKVIVATKLR